MSELKVYHCNEWHNHYTEFYLKFEADKVIADLEESHKKEVGQLLIEIAEQKSEIERLEILCANYRHDCDNLAISNEQVKKAARTLLKKMNHNKRKRCLAMAKLCHWKMGVFIYKKEKNEFYYRWYKRWLAIAEKFKDKEAK